VQDILTPKFQLMTRLIKIENRLAKKQEINIQ